MGWAISSSTPALVTPSSPGASIPAITFTPPGGALLVLMFVYNYGYGSANGGISSVTDTRVNNWERLVQELPGGAPYMDAEIWIGDGPATSESVSVTVGFPSTPYINPTNDVLCGVVVVTGAKSAAHQSGQTNTTSAGGTASPSCTLSSLVGADSLIIGVGCADGAGTVPTALSGQSLTFNGILFAQDPADTSWAEYITSTSLAEGSSQTIGATFGGSQFCDMCAAEILASGGGGPSSPPVPFRTPNRNAVNRAAYY